MQSQLSEEIARKDQIIQALETEKSVLEYKNSSLLRTVELLSSELERCTRTMSQTQQNNVELCMQSLDFKAEVDHLSGKILDSISARIGFVPGSVQKAIDRIMEMRVRLLFLFQIFNKCLDKCN